MSLSIRRATGLIVLAAIAAPLLLISGAIGLFDWLREARRIWWRVRSSWQSTVYYMREMRTPGIHLRERAEAMMPNPVKPSAGPVSGEGT